MSRLSSPPTSQRRVPRTPAAPAAVAAAASAALLLTGCAAIVGVSPAKYAADPACASVLLALPESLGDDLTRVRTTSQGTAAWGDTRQAVVLRCGVEPPGPTTDPCVTMETASGAQVDWLISTGPRSEQPGTAESETVDNDGLNQTAAADPALNPGDSDWTFLTYGRNPAVEVWVPAEVADERSTAFLDALIPAISAIPAERSCV